MKLSLLQALLRQKNLDLAFFVHPDPNLTYFTQHEFSYALLAIFPSQSWLFVTKLDQKPHSSKIHVKVLDKDWEKQFSFPASKIGINAEQLPVSFQQRLQKMFPHAAFVDLSLDLKALRSCKTKQEVHALALACHITDQAFAALVAELPRKTLKTEQEVAFFLEQFIKNKRAQLAFPTIVAMGKNAAIPHHVTSTQKLGKGFLQLDFGARWKNYCADMSRVIYVGDISQEEQQLYHLLRAAQREGVQQIAEGKTFQDIDKTVRKKLGKYSSYFIHSLGHGIGVEVHEAPTYSDPTQKVQKNQVFTIEPGIYFPGKCGLRIEDTVYFDGKAARVLTKSTKELLVIP